jgi:signal transduction histidine kinase/CheY-like chemotaxis protein
MSAESNFEATNITIISGNSLHSCNAYNLLKNLGYLVHKIGFAQVAIADSDLILLGEDDQLADCLANQIPFAQTLAQTLKTDYPDIPVIYLKNYGEFSELQTAIFLSDISERSRSGQRIKQLKQQNLDLVNQLQKVKDAGEFALKAKNEFLTRISHELRAPLNGILGFSQLMSWDQLLTMEQRSYTDIIYDGGKHLLSLVNDILEMSKIESHRLEIDKRVFVLREMINDLKHIFSPKAEKQKLELILKIAEEVPICVQSDEVKIRQILVNVLNNAIKFTQSGSITLNTFMAADISSKSWNLVFEIEDTGTGISCLEIDRVFEPFTQKGSEEETGLGLSISKHFALLLQGDLSVTSNLGEGTTFTLSVPVEIPDGLSNAEDSNFKRGSFAGDRLIKLENQERSNLAILLAEDSFVDQKVLVRTLNQMGYAVDVAGDGFGVLAALDSKFYDIILMDVQMPNMDGIEATKQILTKLGKDNSPIIVALTSGTMPKDRDRCLMAGMDDFITKPLRPKQLKAVLDLWQQKLLDRVSTSEIFS